MLVKPATPLIRILDLSPPPSTHMYRHDRTPSRLRRDSDALKHPLHRNPGMLTKKSTFPSTPSIGVGRGCPNGFFLFACVRVGHRYIENQYLPHVLIRFAQVRPKGEFRDVAEEPSYVQVMPVTPVTPLIRILDLSPPPNTLV